MLEDEYSDFGKHRARFYEMIGYCITGYQSLEDYLPTVFAAALSIDAAKATAIFTVARGLEAKLNLISAALTGADGAITERWASLLKRVASAAANRNQIAHARPVNNCGLVQIPWGKDGPLPGKVTRIKRQRMELHKRVGGKENIWTLEMMFQEAERSSTLFRHLIAFLHTIKGEEVPPHLLEE